MAQTQWRVPLRVPVVKLAIAIALAVLGVTIGVDGWQRAAALVVAAGGVVWAIRDLVARVRLAADINGVTVVAGFAQKRRFAWPEVARVRVDTRRHSRMLEVDVRDTLYLFSRYDLDDDLDEVAEHLERLRTGDGAPPR